MMYTHVSKIPKIPFISIGKGVSIAGVSDQEGEKYLFFQEQKTHALAPLAHHQDRVTGFLSGLAKSGIVLPSSTARANIDRGIAYVRDWPPLLYVAATAGMHCGAFVKPDGSFIGKPTVPIFGTMLRQPLHLSQAGSLEGWQQTIRTFIRDRSPVATMSVCLAFAGPVLDLMSKGNNPGIELLGETSIGKSKALDVAASVWGAPLGDPGSVAISLRSTTNGIEQRMLSRGGAFVAADEVGHLGRGKQQEVLGEIVFLLGEGVERERYDNPAAPRARMPYLLTTNKPIAHVLADIDRDSLDPILARLITIPADEGRGHGIFNSLPKGYASSGAVVDALDRALADNHGHAADAFLKRWAKEYRKDEAALRRKVDELVGTFRDRVGADRNDGRAERWMRTFGAAYAAGSLASDWCILPIKTIMKPLIYCYRRATVLRDHNAAPRKSAVDLLHEYTRKNRALLVNLDDRARPRLSTKKLNKHSGFLITRKGRRVLVMRTQAFDAAFGTDGRRLLAELERMKRLIATEGRQTQLKVRKNSPKDRVYAMALD